MHNMFNVGVFTCISMDCSLKTGKCLQLGMGVVLHERYVPFHDMKKFDLVLEREVIFVRL